MFSWRERCKIFISAQVANLPPEGGFSFCYSVPIRRPLGDPGLVKLIASILYLPTSRILPDSIQKIIFGPDADLHTFRHNFWNKTREKPLFLHQIRARGNVNLFSGARRKSAKIMEMVQKISSSNSQDDIHLLL